MELNKEAMEIAEEEHCRIEEVRLNLTIPLTSEVEASKLEIYGGARTKTTSRAKLTFVSPSALHQKAVAPNFNSSYLELRQGWPLEEHAVLLVDEIFNIIPGTVNKQNGTASKNRKTRSGSKVSEDEVFNLPKGHDTPLEDSGHGPRVTFRSLVVRPGSVSSTAHLVPQPVSFDVSKIYDVETSLKDTDSETEVRPKTLYPKSRVMCNDASITSHSLQLMVEEFRKICEPQIQRLRGRYSAKPC